MPTLNERVLHKLGSRGSVVVAVPGDWLRYYGLKPGDKVQVIADGELTIPPLKRQQNDQTEISGGHQREASR